MFSIGKKYKNFYVGTQLFSSNIVYTFVDSLNPKEKLLLRHLIDENSSERNSYDFFTFHQILVWKFPSYKNPIYRQHIVALENDFNCVLFFINDKCANRILCSGIQ